MQRHFDTIGSVNLEENLEEKEKKLKGKALNKSSKETLTMGFTCLFHKEKKNTP